MKIKRYQFYNKLNKLGKEIIINFIINLSSTKRKKYVYNTILIIINKYIKIIKYLIINKIINTL